MNKPGKCLYYQDRCAAPFKCAHQTGKEGFICKKGGIIEGRKMYLDKAKWNREYKHGFKIPYQHI